MTPAQLDPQRSSGVTLVPTTWFEGLVTLILSCIALNNDLILCLKLLTCILELLVIVSHSPMGLLGEINEFISAKWLELAKHRVSSKFTIGIKFREAVESSVSYGTQETDHGEIVYAASWAEGLSADLPVFEPQERKCLRMCGGPCRQEVK